MMSIRRAARGAAAAVLVMAGAGCSNNSNLGDILGGVLGGGGGSQVTGTITGVNTRLQQIGVQQSNGSSVTLNYDNNTQVVYQNRNYSVTNLEYGDRVTARVTNANNSNGGYYTDLIQVDESATSGGVTGNVQQFEGTVRSIDRTNGLFSISTNNYGTLTVSMPYNPSQSDLNRFNNLRNGDFVRLNGVMLNNSRVELRNFY